MATTLTRIEYNGITIEPGSGYTIKELQGINGIEIRISRDDLTGRAGGNIWERQYAMRTIAIEGRIHGDDVDEYMDLKRALVQAFSINSEALPMTIRTWDGTEKSIDVKVILMPLINEMVGFNTSNDFRVEVIAENPFWEDTSDTVYTAVLQTGTGFTIPFAIPFSLGSLSGGSVTVTNNGDVEAEATMIISGVTTSPRVTNETTGETFAISGTYVSTDVITITRNNRTVSVTLNGTDIFSRFSGTFFTFQPGANVISFESSGSADPSALLTINFRSQYIAW